MLWKSADWLVDGAVTLANRFGVSQLVIGLTVVAMGTSAPEVAASIAATLKSSGDIAIGNVYGSNISNLALVAGLSAIISPIVVHKQILKRELPAMIATTLLLWPILINLTLSRLEGLFLLSLFVVLIVITIVLARREKINTSKAIFIEKPPEIPLEVQMPVPKSIFLIVIGLAGLAIGADISVRGAVFIGQAIGLSEAVIGLTIIAVGTSLPELVTSVVAAAKKHSDISIGNLVGSNIFNTLLVTGTAGIVKPFMIDSRLIGVDYWTMVTISAGFGILVLISKRTLGRIQGFFLLAVYTGYIVYLLT